MTLEQAAALLGIPVSASKAEITAAYRQKVAQYHPDAHIGGSDAEKAAADKMFKAITQARKIMLNPASAAQPEVFQPRPQTQTRPQTPTYSQTPTWQQGASSQGVYQSEPQPFPTSTERPRYNTATSFQNKVPRVMDDAERQLHGIYQNDAKDMYKKTSDVVRLTPTALITIAFIAWAAASVVTDPAGLSALTFINPFVVLVLACLAKLLIWDCLISYYVYKAVSRAGFGWTLVIGIDTIIVGVIAFVVLTLFGGYAPLAMVPAGIGLVFLIIGLFMRKKTSQR